MMTKNISLLGATGSIGTQTLDIIQSNKEQFNLVSFSAGMNIGKVREITAQFRPEIVSVMRKEDADTLQSEFPETRFFAWQRRTNYSSGSIWGGHACQCSHWEYRIGTDHESHPRRHHDCHC